MKKFRNLCIAIIALVGLSSSVFAQSGQAPYVGGTHNYKVDDHSGSTYAWSVTTDFQGLTDASGLVGFSATTGNAIDITWNSPALATTYFVHVVETNAEGCSNHKVMSVIPVNGFVLALASVNASDVVLDDTVGKKLDQCAPNVLVDNYVSATDIFTYNYGVNTFFYKITASGIGSNGWKPQFTLGTTDTAATYVATWGITDAGTGNAIANLDGATANDIIVAPSNPSIWIKVVVTNAEGIAANPIVVDLLGTSVDENDNVVTSVSGSAATQSVKARPNTSGITAI